MPKGFKVPKSSKPREIMRATKPKENGLLSPASKLTSAIPSTRPTSMRNLGIMPAGFKPGKY